MDKLVLTDLDIVGIARQVAPDVPISDALAIGRAIRVRLGAVGAAGMEGLPDIDDEKYKRLVKGTRH